MLADGERLKDLLSGAQYCVLLCAPFIKVGVFRTVLSGINDEVRVTVITRWRAAEVASGISDLEVFELVNQRPHTELALLDDLHAKLYLADDEGLAGSANLTAAALGWADRSNVELLLPVTRTDEEVARLLARLKRAVPATYSFRSEIEAEAGVLQRARPDEGQDVPDGMHGSRSKAWLPTCAAPDRLWAIYKDADTTAVVNDTRADGFADLRDLHVPSELSAPEFREAVRETLLLMPAFRRIIERIPQGLKDPAGIALISEVRPDLTEDNASVQWRIVRDWISEFFQEEFEVAPESFVTRLKAR